jgi:membrane-associated phospholipid phosphatase
LNSKRVMQPSPEMKKLKGWGRLTFWMSQHQPVVRLASLTVGLLLCLLFLPVSLRIAFWDGLLSHKIVSGMLIIFSLLAVSLVWSAGQHFDAWAFLFFNLRGKRPVWLDRLMLGFTQIGNGIYTPGLALVFFLASDRLLAYELLLGTLTLWLVVELLKYLVHRSRPFIHLAQARIVGHPANGRSFPSGHTSQVFFMATLIAEHFHAAIWVALLLYTIALLVGITRMYVGAHYPRDVLAGAILGSAWGLVEMTVDGYVLSHFANY